MKIQIDDVRLARQFTVLQRLPGFVNPAVQRLFACLGQLEGTPAGGILEVGVFGGQSLLALGCSFNGREALGVDPFFDDFHNEMAVSGEDDLLQWLAKGQAGGQRQRGLQARAQELQDQGAPGLSGRVKLAVTTQDKFFSQAGLGPWAVVHLDGEHSFQAVAVALTPERLARLLLPGGILILDDFNNATFPGITEALHRASSFRAGLEPLVYGFGKGVFAWQWTAERLEAARSAILQAWEGQADVAQYRDHDGAPVLHHRAVSPDHSSLKAKIRRRLHRWVDAFL